MKSKLPFYIVVDFETVNIPIQQALPEKDLQKPFQIKKWQQQALSYSWKLISSYHEIINSKGKSVKWQNNESKTFKGNSHEEVINEFVKDMKDLNKNLFYKLRPNHVWNKNTKSWDILNNMIKLSEKQEIEYKEAKNCNWCRDVFNEK